MKDLKTYMEFDQILEQILNDIHTVNNKYVLNPELKLEEFGEERERLNLNLELIEKMCLKILNGRPDRFFDFKRHLKFSHDCDYRDMLNHDFPTLKKWIYNKILDPRNRVFIAMSFTLPGRENIQRTIEEACLECGYEATTVDKEEFNYGITDKIIQMINNSKFVIAEFSENKHGVYYEAGFAEGQGKQVIYCVHESHSKDVHFDIKHINQIRWSESTELKEKLINRIKDSIL